MENEKRYELAKEAMKIFIHAQCRYRRISIKNRILHFLGIRAKADWDINCTDIAKMSFLMADEMIKSENESL